MVWSDPEIIKLSREFVPVAEEAYYLYPEHPSHLQQAKNREDHNFFARYGEQVPARDWNSRGTKQGLYMMGPDAEYLEGKFAASGEPADVLRRMRAALSRWDAIKQSKGYANGAIPAQKWAPPSDVRGELVLRVNSRDLPRGPGDKSGARRHELPPNAMWIDFVKWAWNENWVGIASAQSLVPSGKSWSDVDASVARMVARKALIDNVRGQTQEWTDGEIQLADLKMRNLGDIEGGSTFEYSGVFVLQSGNRRFDAKLYGTARYVTGSRKFVALDWVIVGMRSGAARFNQRENDPGPAPMGITLSLSRE